MQVVFADKYFKKRQPSTLKNYPSAKNRRVF